MASIQTYIIKFWFRHLNVFGNGDYNPQEIRSRSDKVGILARARKGVQIAGVAAGSVPSEWLIPDGAPNDRALLYIHGGAWMMGSANTHRALVSRIAYASGIRTLLINYRLAPEHPFPAGLEDCIEAYEWLVQNGFEANKIILAGDSAGGNLTLALLVALRDADKPLPAGAITLSPATDLAFTGNSLQTRLHLDPIFSGGGPTTIVQDYITHHDPYEPLISPLYADLQGLPPLLIHVGDYEILLDDAVRFGNKAVAAGVDVKTVVWPEMFHVFQIWAPLLPEANRAIQQIANFICSKLQTNMTQEGD
ncbi:MAG TPA: alpha/beta hydrolase [Anaerolineales bacterium]|nr:alpha/beta hydrolase [Anaerolineales bacterium]